MIYTAQTDIQTNRQVKHSATGCDKQTEGSAGVGVITCHPGRHHVHLGGVWLQHAIQLLLGC